MTNGEKIKEIFPDTKTITQYDNPFGDRFMVFTLNKEHIQVNIDWWNTEYKEPTKNDCAEQNGCITCSLDDGDDCCRKLYEESMQEPTTQECQAESDKLDAAFHDGYNNGYAQARFDYEQESTPKNYLGVDCIDRAELLKAMDTWDKFGNDPNEGLIPLRTPALQDRYVPYVKYDDMVNCVKGLPSVIPYMSSITPQEPKIVPIAEIKYDEDKLKELVNKAVFAVTSQEPKIGHWIIIDDCELFMAKCSECGEIADSRMISKYPYCHCGAKMVGSQESEE